MGQKKLEKLKELALDIKANVVFTSWQCKNIDELIRCFMPLALGIPAKKKFTFFYSRMGGKDQAPQYVNGMPVFCSVSCLTKDKEDKLKEIIKKLDTNEKETLRGIQ